MLSKYSFLINLLKNRGWILHTVPTDRNQQSWVFLNDKLKYFANGRKHPELVSERHLDLNKYQPKTHFV